MSRVDEARDLLAALLPAACAVDVDKAFDISDALLALVAGLEAERDALRVALEEARRVSSLAAFGLRKSRQRPMNESWKGGLIRDLDAVQAQIEALASEPEGGPCVTCGDSKTVWECPFTGHRHTEPGESGSRMKLPCPRCCGPVCSTSRHLPTRECVKCGLRDDNHAGPCHACGAAMEVVPASEPEGEPPFRMEVLGTFVTPTPRCPHPSGCGHLVKKRMADPEDTWFRCAVGHEFSPSRVVWEDVPASEPCESCGVPPGCVHEDDCTEPASTEEGEA